MSVSDSTYPAPCNAAILEGVLLAIIETHSKGDTEEAKAKRLQTAMDALIGPASPDEKDMEAALQYMIRQRQRAICDAEMQALLQRRSFTLQNVPPLAELAEEAAKQVLQCRKVGIHSAANKLCALYRQHIARSATNDPVNNVLTSESVERICNQLYE